MNHLTHLPPWVFNLHNQNQGIPRTLAEGIQARIFPGQQAMLSVVRFEPDSEGTMHSHPEEQWGVLLEGSCTRIQNGEHVECVVGDFWCSPGGSMHGIVGGPQGCVVLDIFSPPREEYKTAGSGFGAAKVQG